MRNTTIWYVWDSSQLVQSRVIRIFQMLITSRRLKGRGGTVKISRCREWRKNAGNRQWPRCLRKRILLRTKHTGACLSVRGTTVTGTVLSTTKSRNFLFARYNSNPPNTQNKCNGWMQTFFVRHALEWTKKGLVIARHNDIRYEIVHLARNIYPLTAYAENP